MFSGGLRLGKIEQHVAQAQVCEHMIGVEVKLSFELFTRFFKIALFPEYIPDEKMDSRRGRIVSEGSAVFHKCVAKLSARFKGTPEQLMNLGGIWCKLL